MTKVTKPIAGVKHIDFIKLYTLITKHSLESLTVKRKRVLNYTNFTGTERE